MINFGDGAVVYKYHVQRDNTVFHPERRFGLIHYKKRGIESSEFFAHHSQSNFFGFFENFCFEYIVVYMCINIHIYVIDNYADPFLEVFPVFE